MKAIISDIHGNMEALQAVLADIKAQGIREVYCLGDVVGYGPNPRECIDLVMESKLVLLGNHDQGAMFDPDGFNQSAERAIFWTRGQLEAAALLSQVGYVSLPVELVEKIYYGERLNSAEAILAGGVAKLAPQLLGRIPRLERVIKILDWAAASAKPVATGDPTAERAAVLAAALEFDALLSRGQSEATSLATLRAPPTRHEKRVLEALATLFGANDGTPDLQVIALGDARLGMILQDDVRTDSGTLLVSKGYEVTESFLQRMRNFGESILAEKVRVTVAKSAPMPRDERGVA